MFNVCPVYHFKNISIISSIKIVKFFSFKNDEQGILSNLKLWVCSGEPLPVSLAKQFLMTFSGHTLCNFYGSTEIMADVSYYAIKSFDDLCFGDKIPIGTSPAIVLIVNIMITAARLWYRNTQMFSTKNWTKPTINLSKKLL